jgi:tetratricopeptide (TPR) repeat protein
MKNSTKKMGIRMVVIVLAIILVGANTLIGSQDNLKMHDHQVKQFQRVKRVFYSGQLLFLKNKFDKAEKKLLKCLEVFPELANASYYLGQIYYSRKEFQKAKTYLEQAVKHYQSVVGLQNNAQQKYLDTLRRQRDELQEILRNPDAGQKTSKFEIQHIKDRIERINVRLRTPINIAQGIIAPARYHWHLGNAHLKLKEYNAAERQYILGIKTDNKHANSYNNLVNLYYMFKKYSLADQVIKQAESQKVKLNEKLVAAVKKAAGQ